MLAAKFDALAGQKEFKKYLVAIQKPKEKHPECYPMEPGFLWQGRLGPAAGLCGYITLQQVAAFLSQRRAAAFLRLQVVLR